MLKLNAAGLKDRASYEKAGIELPRFDVAKMISATTERPVWVHFGSGNIFRAFIASLAQELLNNDVIESGIVAVESYDEEIVDDIYAPHDNLSLLALMNPDGSLKKRVIASIAQSLVVDGRRTQDWSRLKRIFKKPSLQLVSFTITEKGYGLKNLSGEYLPQVRDDFEKGPDNPANVMAKVTALAYARYKAGELPVAFVSMDNCSRNGEKFCEAVKTFAGAWYDKNFVSRGFLDYINNPDKVSFPWTMIDKITPRPSETVASELRKLGFADTGIVCTAKKTYIAPFVNSEVPQYLVVEDRFPNGRMPLEKAGVLFTDRETVQKVEKMKVSTCLNPLHTALAVFGCLLGYTSIAKEMQDPVLSKLVEKIGYSEGLPVAVDPGIIRPRDFLDEVVKKRLPNAYIPDTPQRIATDTSEKLAVRYGETIKSYCSRLDLDVKSLVAIPLVIAGWCRYLCGLDDGGNTMDLSFDPMMEELKADMAGIKFGDPDSADGKLRPILSNAGLFGVDLYSVGLGDKVEGMFAELLSGPGAVRRVLEKYTAM